MGDKNDEKFGCTVNGVLANSCISYLLSFWLQFFLVKLNYCFYWIVVMLHRFYSISKLISFGYVSNVINRISFGQTNERFGLITYTSIYMDWILDNALNKHLHMSSTLNACLFFSFGQKIALLACRWCLITMQLFWLPLSGMGYLFKRFEKRLFFVKFKLRGITVL